MPLGENEVLERPPVPLDENSVLLVSDRRTVKRFDLASGQISWIYRESKNLPVNGPPRLLGDAEHLLVLHDGRLLIRLDPATGVKRWEFLLGEDLSERPESMAWDDKNLYCVNYESFTDVMRQSVLAISLDTGSRVWACPIAGPLSAPQVAVWSISLSERALFAYPKAAISERRRPWDDAGDRAAAE